MGSTTDTLLDLKANTNIKDQQGRTAVQIGIDHDSMIEMFLAAGAETSDILVASFAGRADLVKGFLAKDKTLVGARTPGGDTPLHFAARLGHVEVAEALLANGADVNIIDGKSKLTPLHRAAEYGKSKVVALLLAHKADRNAKTWDGKTPLDFAREGRDKETIRLLEEKP